MPEPVPRDPYEGLSPEQLQAALSRLKSEKAKRLSENQLASFRPYPKQKEFYAAGAKYRERLLCAGNQVGKLFRHLGANRLVLRGFFGRQSAVTGDAFHSYSLFGTSYAVMG